MRAHLLAPLACAALLAACGGGGDSPSDGSTTPPLQPAVVQTAIATPAIGGIRAVACGNGATCRDEITDADGKFYMAIGGTLEVRVGPLTILTAVDTSKAIDSVMAFSATGDENDPTFINQMTLLYSLDKDGDPTNGITIDEAAHAAVATAPYASINFAVTPELFVANPAVQAVVNAVNAVEKAPGVTLNLRDPAQVKETVKRLLFKQQWGGKWQLTLDDASASTVDLTIADDGTVDVASGTLTFPLQLQSKDTANMRFSDSTVGSFIGSIKSDGSGKGTWSRVGSTPSAGFWTAKRVVTTGS